MDRNNRGKEGLSWEWTKEGSLCIRYGSLLLLENAYPGIDGREIRPLSVQCRENGVLWQLAEGRILVSAALDSPHSVSLFYELDGFERMPHTFDFIYRAGIFAEGFYQAAEGMGGDVGYLSADTLEKKECVDSYGLCGIKYKDGKSLILYEAEQKNYETVCRLESVKKNFYTDGSGLRTLKGEQFVTIGVRTECVKRTKIVFPPLRLVLSESLEEGLNGAAKEIGENMQARLSAPPAYHWCSWYYCYQNFDRGQLEEYLQGLKRMENRPSVRYIQLDVGYCPAIGDWLTPNERFPEGLQEAFERIRQDGYLPGIWVGAFMVGNRSRLYQEHPDWVLRDLEDQPLRPWIMDNEPKAWGYQDEEYYVLDTSHPEAASYMRNVFSTLKKWGARLFKTDFMLWGLQDSSRVKRYTPGKTSVEYYREYLQLIREAIGEESYWLGCIAPFVPFIGFADGMRIGGDVGSSWNGDFGPQNMMRCLVGNEYTNHNYYQTDPDAVMLRDFQIRLTEREINSLALLAAMSGSCIYTSDPLHRIAQERVELFRFIQPDIRRKPFLPFLDQERSEIIMVHRTEKRGLAFLLNKSEKTLREVYPLEQLGFSSHWKVLDFSDGLREELWKDSLVAEVEPHGCKLYFLTTDEKAEIDRSNLWKNL